MNRADTIRFLCDLVSDVGHHMFKHELEHDCFCGDDKIVRDSRVHERILNFIRNAVVDKMTEKEE